MASGGDEHTASPAYGVTPILDRAAVQLLDPAQRVRSAVDAAARSPVLITGGPRERHALSTSRGRAGYVRAAAWVQVPQAEGPCLVPLLAGASRWYLDALTTLSRRKRQAVVPLLAARIGRRAIGAVAPRVTLVLAPPGFPRPYAWLEEVLPDGEDRLAVLSRVAHASDRESWHVFREQRREPVAFARVSSTHGAARPRSAEVDSVKQSAGRAGAVVPESLGALAVGGRSVEVESHVPGIVASSLLTREPGRLSGVVQALGRWLGSWHSATATAGSAEPPEAVPSANGADALAARCTDLAAQVANQATLVAGHGDLTMWNVVVDGERLGAVDWEAARPRSLPLADLFYAVTDAVLTADRHADRAGAVSACFGAHGTRAELVAAAARPLVESLALSPAEVELAFHSCWLEHAANEARSGRKDGFAGVVSWIAADRDRLARWLRA